MKKVLIIAAIAIGLTACDTKKAVADSGNDPKLLNGAWELTYISGATMGADQLYPNKKPLINFNIIESKVNGNTGCNSFTGEILSIRPGEISFDDNMVMTRMFCEGQGETVFVNNLKSVKAFRLIDEGKTLQLTNGKTDVMRLARK